jgi:hypothetical protein
MKHINYRMEQIIKNIPNYTEIMFDFHLNYDFMMSFVYQ